MSLAVSDAVSRVLGLALDGVTTRQKATADNISNVDLRKETLAAVQTQYQYQMLTRAVNDKFTLVRDSIGGA